MPKTASISARACCLQTVIELAGEEVGSMDAALAAPALALALREFPASVATEPLTVAGVDLQRAVLLTVRCGVGLVALARLA